MIHYYCFVPTTGKITATTKVFKVAVSSSSSDKVAKMCVESYAKRKGFYFGLWNAAAEIEIGCRLVHVPLDRNSISLGYQRVHVPVKKLWEALYYNTLDQLKDEPNVIRNKAKMMAMLSPTFFFLQAQSSAASALPHLPRKNLSVRPSTDDLCAAFGFGAIVFLYWLGGLLQQWEASFY